MREGVCLDKPRNGFDRRSRARADYHPFSAKNACTAFGKRDLDRSRPGEAAGALEQLRSARLEILEVHRYQSINHLPLPIAYTRHVDVGIVLSDAELSTSPEVRGNLRAMDDILARQTGDIGARTSDILSLNDNRSLSSFGEGPRDVLPRFATAQHYDIVLFNCLHKFSLLFRKSELRSIGDVLIKGVRKFEQSDRRSRR